MKRIVDVNGVRIGEGQPKICVPVVARNLEEVKKQAKAVMFTPADIVEWRVDHLMDATNTEYVLVVLSKLREQIEDKPLLVTFRSMREGGETEVTDVQYSAICNAVIDSGMADLIDIEYFFGHKVTSPIISRAKIRGVKVVMSSHDFKKTPPLTEMLDRLTAMKESGADIVKMAAMPLTSDDVLRIMALSEKMKNDKDPVPVVAISMGAMGSVSRMTGEIFGSAMTFASAGKSSAPGQINADELDKIISQIHNDIYDEKHFSKPDKIYVSDPDRAKMIAEQKKRAAVDMSKRGNADDMSKHGNADDLANLDNAADLANLDNADDLAKHDAVKKNVILVGFMGSGKTTVARLISQKTGMHVKEMDDLIESKAGMSIKDIFDKYGEQHFRDLETEMAKTVSKSDGVIVSCGGGTVMREQNVEYLKSSGKIIFLRAKPDTIYERVRRGGTKRPLLNKYMSRGYISTLIKKRRDIYLEVSDYVIDVDDKPSETVADMIITMMDL